MFAPAPGPVTILLVDDDPRIRVLTRSFLERNGYNVLTCGNADHAAAVAESTVPIDLLITDLNMPRRSGMDLGQQLRQLRPRTPVLLVSGQILTSEHLDQLHQNGWTFLDKPFALPKLLASIHGILHKGNTA